MSSRLGWLPPLLAAFACAAFATQVQAQGIGGSREAPPRPPTPTGAVGILAVPPTPPPALRYASFDLTRDTSEARGGELFAKFVGNRSPNHFVQRLSAIFVFDPFTSKPDGAGARTTSVGDLWLRGGVTALVEQGRHPKLDFQYGVEIPTAKAARRLGSGEIDQRFSVLVDKNFRHSVWSNFTFSATRTGATEQASVHHLARFVGQLEVPFQPRQRWNSSYQLYAHYERPFDTVKHSSFQQHGVALQLSSSPVWIGGGFSAESDAGAWTRGGYLRLEWRP